MSTTAASGGFNEKVLSVMDGIEYRRIDLIEEMQDIGRIRSEAYTIANLLTLDGQPLIDEVDFDSHAYVFGVYHEGILASTVRLHHVTPDHRVTTTFSIFPDELNAWLDDGKSLIDPVRLAANPEIMKEVPSLPYITLRLAIMAARHLGADYVIQLSTPQHAAFYKRVFLAREVAAPIIGGSFNIPLGLHATSSTDTDIAIHTRFPFFHSTLEERSALFDRPRGRCLSRAVKPTARQKPDTIQGHAARKLADLER